MAGFFKTLLRPDRLAKSDAELVSRVTEVCDEFGRNAARPAEARALLGLPAT